MTKYSNRKMICYVYYTSRNRCGPHDTVKVDFIMQIVEEVATLAGLTGATFLLT